ncbi:hypothetical protein SCG7086_AD_00250 [Chlamydiales bacterium SCGC AG-110-P3]|nr:hypothetical protein SCG7086_AD_00250 [Chlamydiales bacterium SCGC AG-110-P3]
MLWKPINFQGVVVVDKELVDQLRLYLEEKEGALARHVASAFQVGDSEEIPSIRYLTLVDASTAAADSVSVLLQAREEGVEGLDHKELNERLDHAFWDYVEVLEGSATEFLQQLDHVRLDRLTLDTLQAIDAVKLMIIDKVKRVRDVVIQVDGILSRYFDGSQPNLSVLQRLLRRLGWSKASLDVALTAHLEKTEEALVSRDRQLKDSYQEYNRLSLKVQGSLSKLESYQILKTLDPSMLDQFSDIYRLLKMWKANLRSRGLPEKDITRILRIKVSVPQVTEVFRSYYRSLTDALYDMSRQLKAKDNVDRAVRSEWRERVDGYSRELHSLGSSVSRFRDFLLRTDPNPYVRARWGFTERITGTEPRETRDLQRLAFEIEGLDDLYRKLFESLQNETAVLPLRARSSYQQIQRAVHELSQPLASRPLMRKRGDYLVDLIDELDELGTTDGAVINYVAELLSKALRADWKYHVLHENPGFRRLIRVHSGIAPIADDSDYSSRMVRLNSAFEALREWAKGGSIWRPGADVEAAIERIKEVMQELLSTLQAVGQAGDTTDAQLSEFVTQQRRQLLELRFRFGKFCLQHLQAHPEGGQLRNQFLFVDQYFEFVENKLSDIDIMTPVL